MKKPKFAVGQVVMELEPNPDSTSPRNKDWRIDSGQYRCVQISQLGALGKWEYGLAGVAFMLPEVWLRKLTKKEKS